VYQRCLADNLVATIPAQIDEGIVDCEELLRDGVPDCHRLGADLEHRSETFLRCNKGLLCLSTFGNVKQKTIVHKPITRC